jgi:hypothetical protein
MKLDGRWGDNLRNGVIGNSAYLMGRKDFHLDGKNCPFAYKTNDYYSWHNGYEDAWDDYIEQNCD